MTDWPDILAEAHEECVRLRDENARLREALEQIADRTANGPPTALSDWLAEIGEWEPRDVRRSLTVAVETARAALADAR